MSDNLYDILAGLGVIVYNLVILTGTSFLVVHYDWSGWWFVAAFVIMFNTQPFHRQDEVEYEDDEEDDEEE